MKLDVFFNLVFTIDNPYYLARPRDTGFVDSIVCVIIVINQQQKKKKNLKREKKRERERKAKSNPQVQFDLQRRTI